MVQKDEDVLERGSKKEPDLKQIRRELEAAQADFGKYTGRIDTCRAWWQCEWDNQTIDGRKRWANAYPWPGASDCRPRVIKGIVNEHVVLDLIAFWSAKIQCQTLRPFEYGHESTIAEKMLKWRIGTSMKREILFELPLAYRWKRALGLSFIGIEWEQRREILDLPVTLDEIGQAGAQLGIGNLAILILDPDKAYDEPLITGLMKLFPVLPKTDARGVLNDLRNTGQAVIPVAQLLINKPIWTALRTGVDILFPSETSDIQKARWIAKRELVDESTLTDRIMTDGYDPDFVDIALEHKGEFATWLPGYTPNPIQGEGSDRDMVELIHIIYPILEYGIPCKYKTIFNDVSIGPENLHAVHRKFEYDHQQYPVVALRHSYEFRPLLSSIGIAEESYTEENDIKWQQDLINNHADIVLQPPMIVPTLREEAIKAQYGPRAMIKAMRSTDIAFAQVPPIDQTPILCIQMTQQRLDRRYPITGGEVDPEIKVANRQQLADYTLAEMELCLEQTHQLQMQYETDEAVQEVAGGDQPWNYSAKDIQGQYQVTAATDVNLKNVEYAQTQLDMLAKLMPFQQAGGMVFETAANMFLDPDLSSKLAQDKMSPSAMDRERQEEYNAVGQILSGIEAMKPTPGMFNPQLRLQTMQEIVSDPGTMQKVQQDQVAQKRLLNRRDYFQNQIQQFQVNPQIGRTLSTTTFGANAPQLSAGQS